MKTKYVKMFGIKYYSKEIKKYPWSKWKSDKNDVGQIIPYRYVPATGKFESELKVKN